MKVIILAAGRGKRISRMIKEVPKSTLPIAGVPLIQRTVEMLKKKGFDISICTGYKKEIIEEIFSGKDIKFYYNPFYDVTNSIASLWFAREELDGKDDLIILNADVFFSEKILDSLLSDEREVVMMVDRNRTKTGDYFFQTTDSGCIKKYGKDLPLQIRKCEYVGIGKIKAEFTDAFKRRMIKQIENQQHSLWWENIIYSFADENKDIYTKDVDGEFWSEIDYFDDYERILQHLSRYKEDEKGVSEQ